MTVPRDILTLLCCPKCHGTLQQLNAQRSLTCSRCERNYPVIGEIPVLLIDEHPEP